MKWSVKTPFALTLFFLFSLSKSYAQYYYYNNNFFDSDVIFELGGCIGVMNSITDIGGQDKDAKKRYINEVNKQTFNANQGFYFGAYYKQIVGVRLEVNYGSVRSYDSLLVKGTPRYERNLSFRSDIREISLHAEFHPLFLMDYDDNPPVLSPYIIAGIGWFNFNPQAKLNNQWVDLKALSLEGQGFEEYPDRKPYKLSQANIGGGLGIKYELLSTINIRLEWVHRYLFTDYLDDVSKSYIDPALFSKYLSPSKVALAQSLYLRGIRNNKDRGEPRNTDAYFTFNFKVGITFGRQKR